MSMLLPKRKYRSQDEAFPTAGRGRYTKKDPPSPSVKDYYGVHRPPPKPRSEQTPIHSTSTRNITNARSLSVPSLRTTVDVRVKESPPHSPAKPRSTSVRLNPKKTLSFKRFRKMFDFGSRSELEDGSRLRSDEQTVGTYHKLSNRPRSIGSDCSNSSYTYGADFNRNDSFRVSGHSRASHGVTVDSVFDRHRQYSYDSNDINISHAPSNSTDSNLRPHSIAMAPIPRSCSSSSLKNLGLHTRVSDNRHHSIAAMPLHSTEVPSACFGEERGYPRRPAVRIPPRTQEDTVESLWVDSSSFDFSQAPVLPSHPEYPQIAQDLMTASPPRRNSAELPPGGAPSSSSDLRRMSDTGTSVDPRRVSNDSGVESSKPFRSQPSTPVAQTLTAVRTEGTSSPETHTSPPHDYLSQGSSSGSLPLGWTSAATPQGLTYYLDHNNQTTHWKLPEDTSAEESPSLPVGWEVVQSSQYGTYFVNHNNKTAMYQHPYHSRPPPPYHRVPQSHEAEQWLSSSTRERKPPPRSHSYRDTQNYRVVDPNASLPRRSKSFKDQETMATVWHSKQLSTVTFVPPSPYQIAEIPPWLKEYVEDPYASEKDFVPWGHYSYEDLNGLDTMIKRMLKTGSEQIVRQFEYCRVAIEQEINSRGSLRQRRPINQVRRESASDHHFQYPAAGAGAVVGGAFPAHHYTSHTVNPGLLNHRHTPYQQSHSHATHHGMGAGFCGGNGVAAAGINPQLTVYTSWSSSEHSNTSTRTLCAHDLEQLQDEEETFV